MKDKQQKKRMYRVLAGYAHGGQDEPHGLGGDREELVGDVEAQMSPLQRWLPQEETTNSLRALSTHEMYCPQEGDRFFSAELVREGLSEGEEATPISVQREEWETFENYVVRATIYFSRSIPSLLGWVQNPEIIQIDATHGYRLVIDQDEEFHAGISEYIMQHTQPPLECYYVRSLHGGGGRHRFGSRFPACSIL